MTVSPSTSPPTAGLGKNIMYSFDNKIISMRLMSLLAVGIGPIIGISVGSVNSKLFFQ